MRPLAPQKELKTEVCGQTVPQNRQMHWAFEAIIDELLAFKQRKIQTNALQSRAASKMMINHLAGATRRGQKGTNINASKGFNIPTQPCLTRNYLTWFQRFAFLVKLSSGQRKGPVASHKRIRWSAKDYRLLFGLLRPHPRKRCIVGWFRGLWVGVVPADLVAGFRSSRPVPVGIII